MSVILATGGYDHKLKFWEAPSGVCIRTIRYPDSQVNQLEITPDKAFLAAGGNPHIRLYETGENQQPVLTLDGHTSSVTSLGFQRDGRYLYSGSEDGTVKVWDLRNPTYSRSFHSGAPVNAVTLKSDRDELISGDANGNVKVWDLGTPGSNCVSQVTPEPVSKIPIQGVDISEDGRNLVAVTNRGTVYVWDPTIRSGSSGVSSFSHPLMKFQAHPPGTYCLHAKISPDCCHLCTTGSDGCAKLWDTSTWELAQCLQDHAKWVWDAAFCADSSYLVTASSDHTARLWNLRTGQVVRQYSHQSAVTCVALNDSSV